MRTCYMIKGNLASLPFREIFKLWSQLSTNQGYIAASHAFLQHTRDKQLKVMILEFIQCLKEDNKQLTLLLQNNGVLAPAASLAYSHMKLTDIRGKTTIKDSDISAILSMNIAASVIAVSQALETATTKKHLTKYRELHMRYALLGAKLIELSKKKGWLLAPAQ